MGGGVEGELGVDGRRRVVVRTNLTRPASAYLAKKKAVKERSNLLIHEGLYQQTMSLLSNVINQLGLLAYGPHITDHREAIEDQIEDLREMRDELKMLHDEAVGGKGREKGERNGQ